MVKAYFEPSLMLSDKSSDGSRNQNRYGGKHRWMHKLI